MDQEKRTPGRPMSKVQCLQNNYGSAVLAIHMVCIYGINMEFR